MSYLIILTKIHVTNIRCKTTNKVACSCSILNAKIVVKNVVAKQILADQFSRLPYVKSTTLKDRTGPILHVGISLIMDSR